MSSSANASGSPLPRLGPTWYKGAGNQGGRGFQPPPAVPAERVTRSRSGSAGSSGSDTKPNVNKFSVLDDDDEGDDKRVSGNSRSEALRSYHRSPSGGPKPSGRSLADLAARSPPTGVARSNSAPLREEGGSGRFSGLGGGAEGTHSAPKIIRFTRERLLSLRTPPGPDDENPPPLLKHLEGSPILSEVPQDPVCWDPFDPEEIWAQVPRERLVRTGSTGAPKGISAPPRGLAEPVEDRRRSSTGPGGGRWQRGVALPPPDESEKRGRAPRADSDNPNDLWDDPVGGSTGAAADFSGFGMIPDDPKGGESGAGDAFDFNAMAEASRRFELERRGSKGSDALSEDEDDELNAHSHQVDPHRPLASAGTMIQSGSGDGANVFEDFETPEEEDEADESDPAVKSGIEDTSASSRLMKMIGVNNDTANGAAEPTDAKQIYSWGADEKSTDAQDPKSGFIPSNPWGSALMPSVSSAAQQKGGLDLASRMEAEQKAREAQIAAEIERRQVQEADLRRRQQEEEEAKRRARLAQQEQAEAAQQQGGGSPTQVELVLMERISTFLENSWGRSDLVSILSTLHAEDSRVIPLLGSVDSLRALIARHPSRVGLRQDPAFGAEMAVLLLTNTQFQQQSQARAREEEMQRREQLRRAEAMQRAAAQQRPQVPSISADAPWFYSDPQNNVQGPFRGEEMRQWLEAGYFKGDLPVCQRPSGPFVPLQALFPDLSVAFKVPDESADEQNAAEIAAAEEEKRAREAEKERLAAEERAQAAAAAAEAERREKEAARKNQAAGDQNQSAQLKMMLGMGKSGSSREIDGEAVEEAPKEGHAKKGGRSQQTGGATETVPSKSNKSQQRQSSAASAASQQPAWGGGASTAPRKSISEIQQEEARAAARLAMDRQNNPRSSSGGWANVAASKGGSTGWSSGAVKSTPAAVLKNPNAGATASARVPQRPSQGGSPSQRQSTASSGQIQRSDSDKSGDDFGASMPLSLENWCKDQMKKLNGSDDLTLVSFCMTLTDPVEIRQYLTAYLGSTPQVNNFASEFISRKDGGKGKQDEWESTVKVKKGKRQPKQKK